jgi:hypothetical protein
MEHILTSSVLTNPNDKTKGKSSAINDFPQILGDILKLLRKHYVSEGIVKAFIKQLFYFIDAQLFNSLLQVSCIVFENKNVTFSKLRDLSCILALLDFKSKWLFLKLKVESQRLISLLLL